MQIKREKYNLSQSSILNVTDNMQDIKSDINLTLKENQPNIGAVISGTVVDENNKPVSGAIIKLMDNKFKALANTATDLNGKYIISMVPDSIIYNMSANLQGKLTTNISPFSISNGQSIVVNFTLYEDKNMSFGAITGNIVNSNDLKTKVISGAIIYLYTEFNKQLIGITYSDDMGIFVFSQLTEGSYIIKIYALGYISSEVIINVNNGEIKSLMNNLAIDPNASNGVIAGKILDENNLDIADADVILYSVLDNNELNPKAFTKTNSIGMYTFINVPDGNYLIKSNKSEIINITTPSIVNVSTVPIYFNSGDGVFSNDAKLDTSGTNFAGFIGGPSDGAIVVTITVPTSGIYDLAVKYIASGPGRPFKISINEVNTGSIYAPPATLGWTANEALTFSLPITLNYGVNFIKFHGDGTNYAPSFGEGTVTLKEVLSTLTYNVITGTLINDAIMDANSNLVSFLGGPKDGSSTVTVKVQQSGTYKISINYRNSNRPMKIDINGVSTGTTYFITGTTTGIFNTNIKLSMGINSIKFHGDGINYSPDLGSFTIELLTTTQSVSQLEYDIVQGILENGAIVDNGTGLAGNLGGPNDGSSTITVNVEATDTYMLAISYRNSDKPMEIDVNGINTGTTYFIAGPNEGLFNVSVVLNEGLNSIKFHGNGVDFLPDLGKVIVFKGATVPTTSTVPVTPTLPNSPVINYSALSGIFQNGAKIDELGNYASFIGGPEDGSVSVPINILDSGDYTLIINYRNNSRILNIDINGINIGSYPVLGDYTGTFTTIITLNSGNNIIKFHGTAGMYAPDISEFLLILNPSITATTLPEGVYDAREGIFENGAKLNGDDVNLAGWIGGPSDGSVTVTINVKTKGVYSLAFEYIGADTNRPLAIDINGVNTGTIYTPPMNSGWLIEDIKTFTIVVDFNDGENIVKFHGNGKDYAPSIGLIKIHEYILSSTQTYDAEEGIFENGAKLNDGKGSFAGWIGGPTDGSVTITVNVLEDGLYNFDIQYIASDTQRPMKIMINNIDSEKVYYFPQSSSWVVSGAGIFSVGLNLNAGNNIIKFHGDGIDYAPSVGLVIVSPIISKINYNELPKDSYNAVEGIFKNGAKPDIGTNFAGWIGGPTDGSVTVMVNVDIELVYTIVIQYIGADTNRPLKVDINENYTDVIYEVPKTDGWTVKEAKTFIIQATLKKGGNTIRFHGDGQHYAPSIGIVKIILPSQQLSVTKTYNVSSGQLINGAKIMTATNFASWLGGLKDGSSTVVVNVPSSGVYNIAFQYLSLGNKSLKIDINELSDSSIYTPPPTAGTELYSALTFTVPVKLNAGDNSIKFHGNGTDYSPDLGVFTVESIVVQQTLSYNTAAGVLANGAMVSSTNKFTGYIGGPSNGASTVVVNVQSSGVYNLFLKYICADSVRPLKIDINNVDTGIIYYPPVTLNWTVSAAKIFTIQVTLNLGNNIIKFYGNGKDYAPDLGTFSLNFISPLTPTIPTSTIPTTGSNNNLITVNTTDKGTDLNKFNFSGTWNGDASEVWSQDVNSTFTLNFKGIQISLVGIKDPRHGIYSISIDNNTSVEVNAYSNIRTQPQTIYNSGILSNGNHSLQFKIKSKDAQINYAVINLGDTTTSTVANNIIPTAPNIPTYSYNVANGVLRDGAILNIIAKLATYIGGISDGNSTVGINIATTETYNLVVAYRNSNRPLKIDINGVSTGTIYNVTGNNTGVFTIPLKLNSGVSYIKFHGDGKSYAPDLGAFILSTIPTTTITIPTNTVPTSTIPTSTVPTSTIPTSTVPTSTIPVTPTLPQSMYNAANGVLSVGATIDSNTGFVSNLGGVNDESVTITVNVLKDALYKVNIQYLSGDTDRPLLYDINNVNSGLVYVLQATKGWSKTAASTMTLTMGLNKGINTIKFHGTGTDLAPSLGTVNITS